MTVSRSWLERLPVRTATQYGAVFGDQHLVRCGVSVSVGDASHRVLGHRSSSDPAHALNSATWELRERVLMIAEVTGHPERTVHGVELERPDIRHEARFIDVVARPWHSTYRPGRDATGIAVHSGRAPAVDAAVRELVERSLNGRFWYEPRGLALSAGPLSVAPAPVGPVTVRAWTRAVRIGDVEQAYALCVIDHADEQILVCGTAVKAGQDAAVAHAQGEAIMIYESVARGLETNYHAASSQARFSSLRGGAYFGRVARLERCLARGEGSGAVDLDRVVVWDLVEGDGVHLVRATADPGTSGLTWWRENRHSHVPIDPFV